MSLSAAGGASLKNAAALKACNAFLHLTEASTISSAALAADARWNAGRQLSLIDGKLIAIKDNICTTDLPTTCASRSLSGYGSPYNASVVKKLADAGAIICGKTNMDEFGMGSHSTNSAFGSVSQDTGGKISGGGSSGGSAVAVASQQCWASIGTDTGGSVRLPAAYSGIVGFKPSYGIISRHGVIPYANSMDTVGIHSRTVADAKQVFATIQGFDDHDATNLTEQTRQNLSEQFRTRPQQSSLRIGFPREYHIEEIAGPVLLAWKQVLKRLVREGHQIIPVSLPTTRQALPAYYVLACAEAASNMAKYDGVKYGNNSVSSNPLADVLYAGFRGQYLGDEVKRRILLGSFTLSASASYNHFLQAQKIRRLVQQDFNAIFRSPNLLEDNAPGNENGIDLLLTPTAPSPPPSLSSVASQTSLQSYEDDVLTVPASLAGLPCISVPTRTDTLGLDPALGSVGLQLTGQYGEDDFVLDIASRLEDSLWNR